MRSRAMRPRRSSIPRHPDRRPSTSTTGGRSPTPIGRSRTPTPRRPGPGSRRRTASPSASSNRSPSAPPSATVSGPSGTTRSTALRSRKGDATSTPTTPGCRTSTSCTPPSPSRARRGSCSTRTICPPTGPWRWPACRSARTAGSSLMGSPRPARTGANGRSAKSRPAWMRPTWSSGSSSRWPRGCQTVEASSTVGSRSRGRARTSRGRTTTRRSTCTAWGPRNRRTSSSGRTHNTRSGRLTPRSPTTASTWS